MRSDRWEPLASHHFLLEATLCVEIEKVPRPTQSRYDYGELIRNKNAASALVDSFNALAVGKQTSSCVNDLSQSFCELIDQTVQSSLRVCSARATRPWIQQPTLDAISQRNAARMTGDRRREVQLNKHIRHLAKKDRVCWLDRIASTGSWDVVRRLRRPRKPPHGKLHNAAGEIVASTERAETFAHHLETVQWYARPVASMPARSADNVLPITVGGISLLEVQLAVNQLKAGRAVVQVAAEVLKCFMNDAESQGSDWLTKLMQRCWDTQKCPTIWHLAQVQVIYKKGCPSNCDNYRPISLVSVLYKVYATLILNRLKRGGAEAKLWSTQFGFRRRRSTGDALFLVRRKIEQAWALKGGKLHLLALDWRKAFDCIAPERLMAALRRFGIPPYIIEIVAEIYSDRQFIVADNGVKSERRPQNAGISQGCPLSPFLFGILMTILMRDAYSMLSSEAKLAYERGDLGDVLFADDTLIVGSAGLHVEEYMASIQRCGAEYGLEIHWGKVQHVPVRTEQKVRSPLGEFVAQQDSMVYLGATLHNSGRDVSDLCRRIGASASEFQNLAVLWKNANVTAARKVQIFRSVIVSKLLYACSSTWLLKADLKKLDGFFCRCLRKILRIPPAFHSRISNDTVLHRAQCQRLSVMVRRSQMSLLDQILNDPDKIVLRNAAFRGGTEIPETTFWIRRRGRPRQAWAEQLMADRR